MSDGEFDMAAGLASISEGLGFESSDDANEGVEDGGGDPGTTLDKSGSETTAKGDASTGTGVAAPAKPIGADQDTGTKVDPAKAAPSQDPSIVGLKEAPRTWRDAAKAEWAKVPPAIQEEVLKREEDMHRGIENYRTDALFAKTIQKVMDPYVGLMQQYGINPIQHVGDLMRAHNTLATGTAEAKMLMFKTLAHDYGVDLSKFASGAPSSEPTYVDPEVKALREKVATLESGVQGMQNQTVEQSKAKIADDIRIFATDPAHKYFNEVADDIAGLIRGMNLSLKDAYERAIYANPVVRAKVIAENSERDAAAKAELEKQKTAEAKAATSANVRASAKRASATTPVGSMDDTMKQTLATIRGRA